MNFCRLHMHCIDGLRRPVAAPNPAGLFEFHNEQRTVLEQMICRVLFIVLIVPVDGCPKSVTTPHWAATNRPLVITAAEPVVTQRLDSRLTLACRIPNCAKHLSQTNSTLFMNTNLLNNSVIHIQHPRTGD